MHKITSVQISQQLNLFNLPHPPCQLSPLEEEEEPLFPDLPSCRRPLFPDLPEELLDEPQLTHS